LLQVVQVTPLDFGLGAFVFRFCTRIWKSCDLRGFSSLFDLTAAVTVAVGMWKPVSFAGFQAPRRAEPFRWTVHHPDLGAPFPRRGPSLSAILARMCRLGGRRSGNRCVSETRVECTFLQILAQSPFFICFVNTTVTKTHTSSVNPPVGLAYSYSATIHILSRRFQLRIRY
jgi:hypothetical protein